MADVAVLSSFLDITGSNHANEQQQRESQKLISIFPDIKIKNKSFLLYMYDSFMLCVTKRLSNWTQLCCPRLLPPTETLVRH